MRVCVCVCVCVCVEIKSLVNTWHESFEWLYDRVDGSMDCFCLGGLTEDNMDGSWLWFSVGE